MWRFAVSEACLLTDVYCSHLCLELRNELDETSENDATAVFLSLHCYVSVF